MCVLPRDRVTEGRFEFVAEKLWSLPREAKHTWAYGSVGEKTPGQNRWGADNRRDLISGHLIAVTRGLQNKFEKKLPSAGLNYEEKSCQRLD